MLVSLQRNKRLISMRPFKRRMRKETDYKARLALLKSGKPRLVVRRHNRNIRVQVIAYDAEGDKTLVEVNSSKMSWGGHPGNIPAGYLAGYEAGIAALKKDVKEAVLDIGLHASTKGGCIYAVAKGAIDAGMEIPVGEDILPDENRIKGGHISEETVRKFEEALQRVKKPE